MEDYRLEQSGQEVQNILDGAAMQTDLTAENERAEREEQALQGAIDDEALARQNADGVLQGKIDDEETRAKAAEKQNADDIDAIEEKIPSGASAENKLATEDYVDDSVATASATFRGTYNLVTDLHMSTSATRAGIASALGTAISGADNNDYAFVMIPTSEETPTEIARVERYKFNGTAWGFEYTLNNSGYTSAQWAAINSGITSGLVQKLGPLPSADDLAAALLAKQDKLTFDSAPTPESTNPVTSGGVYTAVDNEKGARQNADQQLQQDIEAILALIPSAATAMNQLADKAFVNSSIATDTSTFRGTYNLVTDLHLAVNASHSDIATALLTAASSADNNDYCFVQVPTSVDTPTEIRVTERYKFDGTAWAYEYDLNNSGFTAQQWEAINSAITSALVSKLSALPTASELATELAGKQAVLTFDNQPTSGSSNPVKSGGVYDVVAAINAKIPSDADAANKMTTEARIATIIGALDATFDLTSADGHITFKMTQTDGLIASVQILTYDIASAAALTTLGGRVSLNESDISNLQAAYAALTQSDIVIVNGALPSSGQQQNVIYRQPDPDHTPPQFYSDYMWNGSSWVLMATYNNAIDDEPTVGSNNLVKSDGVFNFRSVVRLTLYTGGSLDSLTDGQYGYNSVVPVLRYKKGNTAVDLTPSYHCLYIYNNRFFKYNGTILEEIMDADTLNASLINSKTLLSCYLKLENGIIDSSTGEEEQSPMWDSKRIRTGFLAGPFTITLNSDYYLYDAFKYDKNLQYKGSSSVATLNARTFTADDSEVIRFSIKNGIDGESQISQYDNIVSSFINGYVREPLEEAFNEAVEALNEKDNSLVIDSFIIESGGITDHGQDIPATTRLRTRNYISGNIKVTAPDGFKIYMVVYYNEETYKTLDQWSAFDSYVDINSQTATIGKTGCVARLSFSKNDDTQTIIVEELKNSLSLELISSKIDELKTNTNKKIPQPEMVDFDFGYTMNDFSSIINNLNPTQSSLRMELCYSLFDQLCALYPSYVEKYDPMANSDTTQTVIIGGETKTITIHGMSAIKSAMAENGFNDYPEYANGVSSDITRTITCVDGFEYQVTYTTTPAYKTYLYRFINHSIVNTDINKKRKIFIISNLHGNEVTAPLNLYLFMQQLCTGVINIPDFYKLRASCDFYIIPNLNGYGCYHQTRCNARRVDLNRNFPISAWFINGKDTINDDNLCDFTGPSAGSEFETQLVVNLVKNINPDVCIDHHNTGYGTCQLYSALMNKGGIMLNQLAQQASVDMAIAYGTHFPEYFGVGYNDVLFGATEDSPGYIVNESLPHSYCWWNEYGIKLPMLIEIGSSIQWRNGEQVERLDTYGTPDFYSISEYSLRIQILRYVQFLLKNYNSL